MSLIDRSPGGANIILYTTVLAEIGMLTRGSVAIMGAVMVSIVVLAAGLCVSIMDLIGSEAYAHGESETQVAAAVTRARDHRASSGAPPAHERPARGGAVLAAWREKASPPDLLVEVIVTRRAAQKLDRRFAAYERASRG
jgi:hypothetical protein